MSKAKDVLKLFEGTVVTGDFKTKTTKYGDWTLTDVSYDDWNGLSNLIKGNEKIEIRYMKQPEHFPFNYHYVNDKGEWEKRVPSNMNWTAVVRTNAKEFADFKDEDKAEIVIGDTDKEKLIKKVIDMLKDKKVIAPNK